MQNAITQDEEHTGGLRFAGPVLDSEIRSSRLRRLLSDWNGWRGSREMPSRADFTPADICYLLGNIVLLDVFHRPVRFRYRLIGSNMTARRGFDLTGKFMDEHPDPTFREVVIERNRTLVATRQPAHFSYDFVGVGGMQTKYEVLNLPLSSNGQVIDIILAGNSFPDEESPGL
jgi:hypothetical protein